MQPQSPHKAIVEVSQIRLLRRIYMEGEQENLILPERMFNADVQRKTITCRKVEEC